nr:reverse transcriptase domain-containing protein [Tanacetum cinerariifolium]
MVYGKDSSDSLMADNLPKFVWYSTHHVALMKSWLVQKQTDLGKDKANPFIVDSLLKTIWLNVIAVSSKLLLFGLTNWCCLLNAVRSQKLARMGYEKPSTKLTFYKEFFSHQWKFLIYTILQCMSAKRTSWNEFSSSMASAVICLSTGKGCSRVETSLFEGMIVAHQVGEGAAEVNVDDVPAVGVADEGAASVANDEVPAADKISQALEITKLKQRVKKLERRNKASKLRRLKKVGTTQRIETSDDTVIDDVSKQRRIIADMDADQDITLKDVAAVAKYVQDDKLEESLDVQGGKHNHKYKSIKLTLNMLASATITAAASQLTTAAALTLTTAPSAARRRKEVVIRDPEETATPSIIIHTEAKSKDKGKGIMVEEPKPLKKQAQIEQDEAYARELEVKLNKNIDWDEVIDHVQRKEKEDNAVKRYQALKRKPQTEAQARKNMMIYLRNVAGFKMDYFKGMTYNDIRPIFEKKFNSNVAFLQKTKEQMEEEDSRALKRMSESQEDKAAKKQKLDEEVEELRKHLMIVPNEDDDVYTEATALALKVPVVDYEIYTENNKPYYKIKRADGSHQLYLSFFSMLRNFDREDLGAMFEKPDIQAQIWKNQRSIYGLEKRKYPLTRFTLDQMLNNVRLEVEEESEVSLELMRFIRQQQQEEAKALPTNDAWVVVQFFKSLFARFGTPRAIISDRGTHFYNDQFAKVMLNYGVTHSLFTVYHPQTSGQIEVSNRGLKRILERTIETKSDEVIKSSVEDLVPIPSESEGILDNMCDVPFSDKNHFNAESDLIESLLTRDTSIVYSPKIDSLLEEFAGELAHIDPIPSGIDETDSYDDTLSEDDSFEDINYVEASPLDSELVSLKEVKDEILRAKLLNIHLLIDNIESLNNNHTPDCVLKSPSSSFLSYSDNSLSEFKTLSDHTEETSSGCTTTHADNSLPDYDLFLFEIEPDQGELSSVAMEAILGEPRVYVPNVLPIHPTLYQDSDFSSSDDSFGSGLEVYFPSGTRNKIFDPGIFIEV